jgi:hypothetical protein
VPSNVATQFDTQLFAGGKVFRSDANLDYAGFVDAGNAHVLKHAIIYFALASLLDYDLLATGEQGPECGRLGLF